MSLLIPNGKIGNDKAAVDVLDAYSLITSSSSSFAFQK